MICAIDLGLRMCGVSMATMEGRVVDAWLSRSEARPRVKGGQRIPAVTGPRAWRAMASALYLDLHSRGHLETLKVLAFEWPKIYQQRQVHKRKGGPDGTGRLEFVTDPNNLLHLAAVAGALTAALSRAPRLARYELVLPSEWKRSYPKRDFERAIWTTLLPEERAIIETTPASMRGHVTESAGVAKYVATLLAGAPTVAPVLQGRVRAARKEVAPARTTPAWKTPLPPHPGGQTYGERHGLAELVKPRQKRGREELRRLATPASYAGVRDASKSDAEEG